MKEEAKIIEELINTIEHNTQVLEAIQDTSKGTEEAQIAIQRVIALNKRITEIYRGS